MRGVAARPRTMQMVRGPLRYETHEVRHLLAQHGQSLSVGMSLSDGTPLFGRVGPGRGGRLGLLGMGNVAVDRNLRAFDFSEDPQAPGGVCYAGGMDAAQAPAANQLLEEVGRELRRYRSAIEQSSDPLTRGLHVAQLNDILDEQEQRARTIAQAGAMPPFKAIVKFDTARAAGLRLDSIGPVCDRGLSWRIFSAEAWDTQRLLANQAVCAAEDNRIRMGAVPDFRLVFFDHELRTLATHLQ